MPNRAVLFIDGNNWYHSLKTAGVGDLGRLSYVSVSQKLVGPREWVGTRYYIGRVRQGDNRRLYADQRRFLDALHQADPKISVHLGRLEPRSVKNAAAEEILHYLNSLQVRIDQSVYQDLMRIAHRHRKTEVVVEKAVDVMLAVDMVVMAERDEYDCAYLLSADGDYTPAVEAAVAVGKTVYVASPGFGAQLGAVSKAFIRLDREWFDDCF